MAIAIAYRTIDVRPADGWRAVYLLEDGHIIEPMPGWLIQEEVEYDDNTFEDIGLTGHRQLVPATVCDGELKPAQEIGGFWYVIGPGQVPPTDDDVTEERARRTKARP
jgi:hypothetical protein